MNYQTPLLFPEDDESNDRSSEYLHQRKVVEVTLQTQEKERKLIGKALQDSVSQILSTTKLYIELAINEESLREELLHKSYQQLSVAIEEIRNLSRSLLPPALEDIGLREALRELIAQKASEGLIVYLQSKRLQEAHIHPVIRLTAYRIIQEQLNNILRHAAATQAEIQLSVSKKMLNIIIRDNGIGFDPLQKNRGFGLENITSRAELYGGKAHVTSVKGNGSSLIIELPIKI